MESAVFLNRLHGGLPEGFGRLYYGSEFCPWTFPAVASIIDAIEESHHAGMAFTLATPVVAESFLAQLEKSLATVLPMLKEGDEVLISDLGALNLVRALDPERAILLGRTLSGQKRGPRILDLDLSVEQQAYFRSGSWYGRESQRLLQESGVSRMELDNLLQGLEPVPQGVCASLHYPYIMVTSSRNCPFRPGAGDRGCPATCGEVFTLDTPQSALPLLQGGNTQFIENQQLPPNLSDLGIDRIVLHPYLPK